MSYVPNPFMDKPKREPSIKYYLLRAVSVIDGKLWREKAVPAPEVDFWYNNFQTDFRGMSVRVEVTNPDGTKAQTSTLRPYIDPTQVWEVNYYA